MSRAPSQWTPQSLHSSASASAATATCCNAAASALSPPETPSFTGSADNTGRQACNSPHLQQTLPSGPPHLPLLQQGRLIGLAHIHATLITKMSPAAAPPAASTPATSGCGSAASALSIWAPMSVCSSAGAAAGSAAAAAARAKSSASLSIVDSSLNRVRHLFSGMALKRGSRQICRKESALQAQNSTSDRMPQAGSSACCQQGGAE